MMKRLIFFLIISTFAVYAEAGLVAWYEFEGDANDSVGSNHGNMINGAQIITDSQRGQVLRLDGENDFVSLAEYAVTTTKFTIAAWANLLGPPGGSENSHILFQQRDDNASAGAQSTVVFTAGSAAGNTSFYLRSSDSSNLQYVRTNMGDFNKWYHYAATVNSDKITLYIDGVEVDSTINMQPGDYVTSIDYIDIGRHRCNGLDHGFLNGFIDDVRFYDYALEEYEIKAIVPEPGTLSLLGFGSLSFLLRRKKR